MSLDLSLALREVGARRPLAPALFALCALALLGCTSDRGGAAPPDGGTCSAGGAHSVGGLPAVAIAGDPGNAPLGFGDPSVAYPAGAAAGYMTYTAVGPSFAQTRIAVSSDEGATWTYAGDVNAVSALTVSTADSKVCGAASCSGKWVHEVSSLVIDDADPDADRRFKVFGHSYFITDAGVQHLEIGSIDLWTAASPAVGAPWKETRLIGWSSSSPRSTAGVSVVATTDPALAPLLGSCVALSEPGALARGGALDLALECVRAASATTVAIEIALVRSADHGATWSRVAMLLDQSDAVALGASGSSGPQMNAADLFEAGGAYYLFATPNGAVTTFGSDSSGYRGCSAFRFADIVAGTLERCGGVPLAVDGFQGAPGQFNGACTYAAGATVAGVLGLTADKLRSPVFQIFASGAAGP